MSHVRGGVDSATPTRLLTQESFRNCSVVVRGSESATCKTSPLKWWQKLDIEFGKAWLDYMQKSVERNPNSASTKMNSLAFNNKLIEKKENADNKYNKIPNMQNALGKVRSNKRTLNLNMVNATTSKTRT